MEQIKVPIETLAKADVKNDYVELTQKMKRVERENEVLHKKLTALERLSNSFTHVIKQLGHSGYLKFKDSDQSLFSLESNTSEPPSAHPSSFSDSSEKKENSFTEKRRDNDNEPSQASIELQTFSEDLKEDSDSSTDDSATLDIESALEQINKEKPRHPVTAKLARQKTSKSSSISDNEDTRKRPRHKKTKRSSRDKERIVITNEDDLL